MTVFAVMPVFNRLAMTRAMLEKSSADYAAEKKLTPGCLAG